MSITNYADLSIWKNGMRICHDVYVLTKLYPKEELFGLVSQMRRSAVSIPSNIAEGFNRFGKREFQRFLVYALGSCGELETQLLLSLDLNCVKAIEITFLRQSLFEEQKMIKSFMNKLRSSSDYTLRTPDFGLRT